MQSCSVCLYVHICRITQKVRDGFFRSFHATGLKQSHWILSIPSYIDTVIWATGRTSDVKYPEQSSKVLLCRSVGDLTSSTLQNNRSVKTRTEKSPDQGRWDRRRRPSPGVLSLDSCICLHCLTWNDQIWHDKPLRRCKDCYRDQLPTPLHLGVPYWRLFYRCWRGNALQQLPF